MFFQGILVTFSQVFIFTDRRLLLNVNFAEVCNLREKEKALLHFIKLAAMYVKARIYFESNS